jgi:hypothetical protein
MDGYGMLTSFETDQTNNRPEKIMLGKWSNNKEDGVFQVFYSNGDVVTSVYIKDGKPLLNSTDDNRVGEPREEDDEDDTECQFIYSDGERYEGDLILKNGKIVPAVERTIFSFGNSKPSRRRARHEDAIADAHSINEESLENGGGKHRHYKNKRKTNRR